MGHLIFVFVFFVCEMGHLVLTVSNWHLFKVYLDMRGKFEFIFPFANSF